MHRKPFLNRSESSTLDLLERSLRGTSWQVYVKPRLLDVLSEDPEDALTEAERRMVRFGHLDFVILNRALQVVPEFAVEFDGPSHFDEAQQDRDRVKDALCLAAQLPLLRIESDMIGEREQITILEWVMDRFVARKRRDPPRDPVFPAIRTVVRRLSERYGLVMDSHLTGEPHSAEATERWKRGPLVGVPADGLPARRP